MPKHKVQFSDWEIETENPFVVILVTNLSKTGSLSDADSILITAVAREYRNGI